MKKGIVWTGVFLLIALLVVYFPLFTGDSILKWDATAIYLPWKLFVCETIFSGNLPLWNPFMGLGFPQMMDLGTWYPISWIFGIGGYGLFSLSAEYLFHVWMGGMGFFLVLRYFKFDIGLSVSLSIVFLFNGFFVGNAQHLGWVVGAAWIPWIFWAFLKWNSTFQSRQYGLLIIVFLAMQFTGGYPAIFVITFYALWVAFVIGNLDFNNKQFAWRNLLANPFRATLGVINWLQIWLLFAIATMPAWLGLLMNLPEITRANGVATSGQMFGSFPAVGLLSVLNPVWFNHWVGKGHGKGSLEAAQTDISMMNGYVGGFLVFAAILFLIIGWRKSWFNKGHKVFLLIAFVVSLFFFMLSMGGELPIRSWFNVVLPGLKYFRFPAVVRIFGIIALLLTVGKILDVSLLHVGKRRFNIQVVLMVLMVNESIHIATDLRETTVITSPTKDYIDKQWITKEQQHLKALTADFTYPNLTENMIQPLDKLVDKKKNFLWYNRANIDRRFSLDGYNPYLLNSYNNWDSFNRSSDTIIEGMPLVSASNGWYITKVSLASNNSFIIQLRDSNSSRNMGKNDSLMSRSKGFELEGVLNHCFVPGWQMHVQNKENYKVNLNKMPNGMIGWKVIGEKDNVDPTELVLKFLYKPTVLLAGVYIPYKVFVVLGGSLFFGILFVILLDFLLKPKD